MKREDRSEPKVFYYVITLLFTILSHASSSSCSHSIQILIQVTPLFQQGIKQRLVANQNQNAVNLGRLS